MLCFTFLADQLESDILSCCSFLLRPYLSLNLTCSKILLAEFSLLMLFIMYAILCRESQKQ